MRQTIKKKRIHQNLLNKKCVFWVEDISENAFFVNRKCIFFFGFHVTAAACYGRGSACLEQKGFSDNRHSWITEL